MILDSLTRFDSYTGVHPLFGAVRDFLAEQDVTQLTTGRHDLAHGIFALVSDYRTKPLSETFIEAHRKYIDIQILVRGAEQIGICDISNCQELPYDESNDFLKLQGKTDLVTLHAGSFAVFFPHDGHMPQVAVKGEPAEVKKIVVKVPV